LTALLLLPCLTGLAQAQTLQLAANEGLAVQRVAERVLNEVYRRSDLRMQVEFLPPVRASLMLNRGEKDGEVARIGNYLQQNPELVRVEPAYYAITTVAYTRQSISQVFRSPADLLGYKVAIVRGVTHAKQATQSHPAVSEVISAESMFKMLLADRIDVALDTGLNGTLLLESPAFQGKGLKASGTVAQYQLHHYLHARHAGLAQRLGKTIETLKASGELERLIAAAEKEVRQQGVPD
jgi:polar amino acid transport system substrate-binding protein